MTSVGEEMFPYMRERLEANGISELEDYNFTGYPFGPLATTPKFLWIKKNWPEIYERTYKFIGLEAVMISAFTDNIEEYWDDKPGLTYTKLSNNDTFELDPKRAEIYDIDINKYPGRKNPGEFVGSVTERVAKLTGLLAGDAGCTAGAGDQRCAAGPAQASQKTA